MQNKIEEIRRKYLSGSTELTDENISDSLLSLFGDLTTFGIVDFCCSLYSEEGYWSFETDQSYKINRNKIIQLCNSVNDFEEDNFCIKQDENILLGYGSRNLWVIIKSKEEYAEIIQSIIEPVWYQFYEYN